MTDLIQSNVNPELQRTAQHLTDAVAKGQVVAIAYIGLTAQGEVVSAHAMPGVPSYLYLAAGALQSVAADLLEAAKQARQQQQVSRILKPNMMQHG